MTDDHAHVSRVFLLSPADCSGRRAQHLLGGTGRSALAERLRSGEGGAIGEVFTFISGLYFRGKLAYATAFAAPPEGSPGVLVIAPGLGLVTPDHAVDLEMLRGIARVPVDADDGRYRAPLLAAARALRDSLPSETSVVLLGSIATEKYVRPLSAVLGAKLRVPRELIGLGVMSRGSLLVRCAEERRELAYVPVPGVSSPPSALGLAEAPSPAAGSPPG